jgi:aminopeptidase YwaD
MKGIFSAILFCTILTLLSAETGPNEPAGLTGRLRNHVAILASDSLEGRGLGTEGKIKAKRYIADQFAEAGLQTFNDDYFQHFDLRIGLARVPGTNVAGYLRGNDPGLRDEYIVIGAHYDHLGYEYRNGRRVIYNGADDNASGVAAVIELAGYFSQNTELLGRSIIFVAFDAEESGLLGSEIFIEGNKVPAGQIRAMISLDMVGMYEANRGLHLLGIGTLKGGRELAKKVAAEQGIRLRDLTAEIPARTDTWPFGAQGIPSFHAFTGLESPYHKPEDTYDLLDYEGMAGITLYLQALVTEMAARPELAASGSFRRMQHPLGLMFNTGVLASIGSSNHIYPDEFYDANNLFAFSTGFFFQVQVGQIFAIQPEILYDFNGSRSPEGRYRRHSLTVPVNLLYYIVSDQRNMVRAYPFAGTYFRYSFAGSDGNGAIDFDLHPSTEWGINLGFGFEVMRVSMAFTWRRGFAEIPVMPGTPAFQGGRYFTAGLRF